MFDDIVIRKREIEAKIKDYLTDEICPVCASADIEPTFGMFISSTKYIQHMVCIVCGTKWEITYDQNLNIINTEI